ncbi:MAG: 30S ribosomal protein S10 [Candidatus Dojkabacteria bacterium]|uniref:Small ribosomal subunit protein uS10 n=2 Tax=Candidatus Dojkabacteria TaxID=74243 RepID=A0A136KKV2_9BACT|nr:MAG: 30S ribosomal protein S10 [candidate division WS6 bacterium OLB21]MBW7953582.1 30S ribosomal protein S10 [Candidatus Dojkabacteria bacterium]WKZ27858.1 MAG: 30S ribosomal protein S10 [Candidatus Dojkabacteria bacterium]
MQRIRIKIKGYDSKVVDKATEQIIDTAVRTGAKTFGPIPLPTKSRRFTVHKSPHVDSKSKDHFELNTHKRLIDIVDPTSKTIDSLTHLQLAAGVWIEIK